MTDTQPCPGCGASFAPSTMGTHKYLGASSGCWAVYTEVLGREYSDMAYMKVHPFTADAYALQHPGQPERRTKQSLAVHLASLYATLEQGAAMAEMAGIRQGMAQSDIAFTWPDVPADLGPITVEDVYKATTAMEHEAVVMEWARQMLGVWRGFVPQVVRWGKQAGVL